MSKEKVQISPTQLTFLIITMVISTADIFIPSFVAQDAKQDSWISPILATLAMMPVVYMYIRLYKQHQGMSLIEICTDTLGKIAGSIMGILFAFYFIFIAIGAVMSLTVVLNITFLPLTPPWVIVVISIIVSIYGAYSDLEVVARINEILLPAGIGALVFLLVLNINEYDLNFFRPVLAEGFLQPVRGGIIILGYFCEVLIILQIFPCVNEQVKINRAAFSGILITGAGILGGTLIYAVFGPLTEVFIIPSLELARFTSIGKYIQNLDVLILAIWITGIYVKIMIFIYTESYAIKQIFRLKTYKAVVFPLGFMLGGIAIANIGDRVTELYFMHYIFPVYSITMACIIPTFLFMFSTVRNKINRRKAKTNG